MPDAHGFLNSVWLDGDMMERMLNTNGTTLPPLDPAISPVEIVLCNHDSITFPRESTSAPDSLASVIQTKPNLTIPADFDWDSDPATIDGRFYWNWNMTDWEFPSFTGTPYTLAAASLTGYNNVLNFNGWGAFGVVHREANIDVGDIVIYLIGNFKIGIVTGET